MEHVAPNLSDTARVRVGRSMTALAGLVALGFAASGESIKGLVEIASSFGSAGILVALLFGLHTKFGDERAAVAALITGGAMSVFGDGAIGTIASWFIGEEAAGELPWFVQGIEGGYVFSVLGALAAYVIVALVSSPARSAGDGGGVSAVRAS